MARQIGISEKATLAIRVLSIDEGHVVLYHPKIRTTGALSTSRYFLRLTAEESLDATEFVVEETEDGRSITHV